MEKKMAGDNPAAFLISGCIAYDAEKAPKVLFETAHGDSIPN